MYYEISAKTGFNVNEIFSKLVQIIHDKYGEEYKKEVEKRRKEEEEIRKKEEEKRRKEE